MTLDGNDINQHLATSNSQHSQGFTPAPHQSHTPYPDSPPSSPLTSIPRKKHSDNSKPINIAVYSAPLSPHSDERSPKHKRPSPPGMNMQMFPLQNHRRKTSSHKYPSHVNMGDHVPLPPRQPPNGSGYEQSPVMQQSYQLAPPLPPKPHPQELVYSQPQQPSIRNANNGIVGSSLGSQDYRLSRRSSAGLYRVQTASSGAVGPHQFSQSSSSNSSPATATLNHSVSFASDQVHPPMFSKQLSRKSLQGHSSLPHSSQFMDEDNLMMSSSSTPALFQHPPHGHSLIYPYLPAPLLHTLTPLTHHSITSLTCHLVPPSLSIPLAHSKTLAIQLVLVLCICAFHLKPLKLNEQLATWKLSLPQR